MEEVGGGGVGSESTEATEAMLLVEEERESGPRPCEVMRSLLKEELRTGEPVNQSP